MTERLLVLTRHGESEWNLKNLFTGWKDPGLTPKGVEEAKTAGRGLKALGLGFDVAFTSALTRAQHTLKLILEEIGQTGLPTVQDWRLNERDYGDLSGLNKAETRQKYGDEQVHIWRRSYDVPPPGGESLKDTVARVLPYYVETILPRVHAGRTRAGRRPRQFAARADHGSRPSDDKTIPSLELKTGVPLVYRLNADGKVESYRELAA
jgi:2,3-bisphosphoglycerate-dependent phosphoglycerate mutase